MATDFTSAEKLGLFQILDVPYSDTFYTLDAMGTLVASTTVGGPSTNTAKTVIETALDAIADAADAGAQHDALQTLVQRWNTISTKVSNMVQGSAGDVNGVSYDPEAERQTIRQRVLIHLPFYRLHEVMAKQAGQKSGGGSVGITRL